MGIFDNYCLYHYNAITISKIVIYNLGVFPKIKKLSFYFIINIKTYKKNLFLFYIMISLIFGGVLVLKKKEVLNFQVFNFQVNKKKILLFILMFINVYLPLLVTVEGILKKVFFLSNKKKKTIYRFNYFYFPLIPELDLLYSEYEMIYNFVSFYRLQLDVFIKICFNFLDSGEFLLRLYKFPCKVKLK